MEVTDLKFKKSKMLLGTNVRPCSGNHDRCIPIES